MEIHIFSAEMLEGKNRLPQGNNVGAGVYPNRHLPIG